MTTAFVRAKKYAMDHAEHRRNGSIHQLVHCEETRFLLQQTGGKSRCSAVLLLSQVTILEMIMTRAKNDGEEGNDEDPDNADSVLGFVALELLSS